MRLKYGSMDFSSYSWLYYLFYYWTIQYDVLFEGEGFMIIEIEDSDIIAFAASLAIVKILTEVVSDFTDSETKPKKRGGNRVKKKK